MANPTSAVEVLAALGDALPEGYFLLATDPCAGSWAVPDTTGGEISYTIMRYRGLLMVHVDIPALAATTRC